MDITQVILANNSRVFFLEKNLNYLPAKCEFVFFRRMMANQLSGVTDTFKWSTTKEE